ncbi:MAG: hypothetical protein HFF67_01685 [Oscillospiraceae bacterium]|nr:hypothetical protein [Oscillospiraceae bacterium]
MLVSILFLERKRIKKNFLRETAFRFCPGYIMHQVPARSKGHGGKFPGSGPVSLEIPGSWAENPAIPPSPAAPPDADAGDHPFLLAKKKTLSARNYRFAFVSPVLFDRKAFSLLKGPSTQVFR